MLEKYISRGLSSFRSQVCFADRLRRKRVIPISGKGRMEADNGDVIIKVLSNVLNRLIDVNSKVNLEIVRIGCIER